ncbi:helix-turn-helix transcriptional regulator [Pseudomonas sp. SDO528_S397]
MNSQSLFPSIGKVIASTGSRNFPRLLHDLIVTKLPVDATHIKHLRVKSPAVPDTDEMDVIDEIDQANVASMIIDRLDCDRSRYQRLADFSSSLTTSEQSDIPSIAFKSQLHLASRKNDYCFIISIYRKPLAGDFSAQEQIILKDLSSLLLPLVEKHINAINPQAMSDKNIRVDRPVPENRDIHTLEKRFEARLLQSGLTLSNREKEICTGLLAGRTAPELAEALSLKVNTVESYLKRSVIKMGISGRHSLIRWMNAEPSSPTLAAAAR